MPTNRSRTAGDPLTVVRLGYGRHITVVRLGYRPSYHGHPARLPTVVSSITQGEIRVGNLASIY